MNILVHNNKKESISYDNNKFIKNNNNLNSNTETKSKHKIKSKPTITTVNNQTNLSLQQLDFSFENRLAQIIGLLSKGLTQQEIAHRIGVHQSTISRDLHYLKQEAKRQIWEHFDKDILFEYYRYLGGNSEISKKMWEIVQDDKNST